MWDDKDGLRRIVFHSISGGFVSVAFGLLGAGAAQAKVLPGDGPGAAQPKPAISGNAGLKAASALPGPAGVMAKVAHAAVQAGESVKKSSGNQHGSTSTGNAGSKKSSGNRDSDSGGGPKKAQSGGSVPGMVGSVSEVSPRSGPRTESSQLDRVKQLVTAKADDGSGGTFPIRLPDPHPMPRNADPDRRQPPKDDEVAHGKVVDRGEAGRGKYEEDHGGGVTTVKDLKTGAVKVNGFDVSRPGAPSVRKLIPALRESLRKEAPHCATHATLDCGDPGKEAVADTARRVERLCSGAIECSDDFVLDAVSTRINRGEQPAAGSGATEIMKSGFENGGTDPVVGGLGNAGRARAGGTRVSPGSGASPARPQAAPRATPSRTTGTQSSRGTGKAAAAPNQVVAPPAPARPPVSSGRTAASVPRAAPSGRGGTAMTTPGRGGVQVPAGANRTLPNKVAAPASATEIPTLRKARPPSPTENGDTTCDVPNSFVPGTQVLLADGSHKPIEQVKVGDHVTASDPLTGEISARVVTALIVGSGSKDLVDLTIDTDGAAGGESGRITATAGHPFWDETRHRWVEAGELVAGHDLSTRAGGRADLLGGGRRTEQRTVYNLSVEGLHTYYVHVQGATTGVDVLVHNCNRKSTAAGRMAEKFVKRTKNNKQLPTANHIPDYWDDRGLPTESIGESKAVKYQSYSRQLKAFLAYAEVKNIPFTLYVGRNTKISRPLHDAIMKHNMVKGNAYWTVNRSMF